MSFLKAFVTVTFFLLSGKVNAQDDEFRSSCPGFFVYGYKKNESDTWYGTLTLLSERDLSGVQLRLKFDRKSLALVNSFGETEATDNKEYSIVNQSFQLKASVPHIIEFHIKYNLQEPIPKLMSFTLNSKTECRVRPTTLTPYDENKVYISKVPGDEDEMGNNATPTSTMRTFTPPYMNGGGFRPGYAYYGGVTYNAYGSTTPAPQDIVDINSICGIITKNRTKRQPHRYYDSYPEYQYIKSPYRYWNRYSNHENHYDNAPQNGESLNYFLSDSVHDHVHLRPSMTYIPPVQAEFPWHANLYYRKNSTDFVYLCGASLITQYHVITPAHCVTQRESQVPLLLQTLAVYLGVYNFKPLEIQNPSLSQIIPHPQYNPRTFGNDIALVMFRTPVTITDFVRPVCRWQDSSDLNSVIDKQGSVIGMDLDETGQPKNGVLMRANMLVKSPDTCTFAFPNFYSRFAYGNTYCGKYTSDTTGCIADSGGSMVFPISNSGSQNPRWQLRGFISINEASQNQFKCSTSHVVVFTDVAKYRDWIAKSTQ